MAVTTAMQTMDVKRRREAMKATTNHFACYRNQKSCPSECSCEKNAWPVLPKTGEKMFGVSVIWLDDLFWTR